ncbi:FAD dependent oxidoreductase [Peniophora sp. CONT]|nr:FAD dependent oxidoreductase [Peniophora sp. CONT]
MTLRPLRAVLNATGRYKYKEPEAVVDHLVIGGGVVGLAIARHLALRFPSKSTILLERHTRAGEETSSRNSEVIHAGMYYPPASLKTSLCLRGRQLLYAYLQANGVPHRRCEKMIVATSPDQLLYLQNLHDKVQTLAPPPRWQTALQDSQGESVLPTTLLDASQTQHAEPELGSGVVGSLLSTQTGIVDVHTYISSLERDIDSAGASIAYFTRAVRLDPSPTEPGWVVQTLTGSSSSGNGEGERGETDTMLARTVINTAGHAAPAILNSQLSTTERIGMFFAKGSYASYRGPGAHVSRLLYPVPESGGGKSKESKEGFASLGTHLTLDLSGNVRFGPDLEWLDPGVVEGGEESVDFWMKGGNLVAGEERVGQMAEAVRRYLPNVSMQGFAPDYVGVRPKLVGPGGGFQDFVFRTDLSGKTPLISLLGIESPGLTASLAIAEKVVEEMLVGEGLVKADEAYSGDAFVGKT